MLILTAQPDSTPATVATARRLLIKPSAKDATLATLAAAAFCAICAVALAISVILGPPGQALDHRTPPSIDATF